jgi:hypothetical protein
MNEQPKNQASGASETTRFFCTRISPAAGAAGELKQHRKEPDMANRNTNPGIGESVDSEVINTHQPSRARTHARVVRPTGILNESLIDIPGARARVRAKSADFTAWRVKTFGGDFDPVREAVEDAVAEFSDKQAARDRSLWLKIANAIGCEAFRDLYFEQLSVMRGCRLRNPSAAFQKRLNRYTGHKAQKGGAQ